MKTTAICGALLLAALLVSAARADLWRRLEPFRVVSPSGRHYAVLRPAPGAKLSYRILARREGAPALADARLAEGETGFDPADEVAAAGVLGQQPIEARVLDASPSLILFERYGGIGYGDVLVRLDADRVRWRIVLGDLFSEEEIRAFPRTEGSIRWTEAFWVDEPRGAAVLVAHGGLFREVALGDGAVSASGPAALVARLGKGGVTEQKRLLELAARLRPEGLGDVALRIANAPKRPLAVRLRAVAAARAGGVEVRFGPDLFRGLMREDAPPDERAYALSTAVPLFGLDAGPIVREACRRLPGTGPTRGAFDSLAALGAPALPALAAIRDDPEVHGDFRLLAKAAVERIEAADEGR